MLAAVAGAHGIAGEVRLKLFTDDAAGLKRYEQLQAGDRALTLKSVRPGPNGAVARFAEIADRTAAEGLRGAELTVPRSALPALEDGEYYHADMIGLPCVTATGEAVGTVVAVENFGAGDILEIELPSGKRTMVPLRAGIADVAGDHVVVDPAFLA